MIRLEDLSILNPADFLMFGHGDLAYMKPDTDKNGKPIWAVHAADGTAVAAFSDAETARLTAARHDLALMDIQ